MKSHLPGRAGLKVFALCPDDLRFIRSEDE
jgi:hypothetical protein